MLKELEGPKHFDIRIYALHKLAQDVERAFCNHFKSETVYYFYESCRKHRRVDGVEVCACYGGHRLVWHGTGLVSFIRRIQRRCIRKQDAPVLLVTPLSHKNDIVALRTEYVKWWEKEDRAYSLMRNEARASHYSDIHYRKLYKEYKQIYAETELVKQRVDAAEYWMGDVSRDAKMICCDPLFGHLFTLIQEA